MAATAESNPPHPLRHPITLPLDIYADIVAEVDALVCKKSLTRNSLNNLSLTSRSLRPMGQRFIFHTISITLRKTTLRDPCRGITRLRDFIALAENATAPLADYIRELQVVLDVTRPLEPSNSALVCQFLTKLHRIQTLDLRYPHGTMKTKKRRAVFEGLNWRYLDANVASALRNIIQSSSLRSLSLEGFMNFPTFALKEARCLACLSIGPMTSRTAPPTQEDSQIDKPTPRPLILDYNIDTWCETVSAALLGEPGQQAPLIVFSRLKNLQVVWGRQVDAERTKSLMHSACRIETLDISIQADSSMPFTGLAANAMILQGAIRTLRRINVAIAPPARVGIAPLGNICEELRQISMESNCLESINLNLTIYGNWHDIHMISDGCEAVDRLFELRNPFPCLKTLGIHALFNYAAYDLDEEELEYADSTFDENVEYLREHCFPHLSAILNIDFVFDVTHDWDAM